MTSSFQIEYLELEPAAMAHAAEIETGGRRSPAIILPKRESGDTVILADCQGSEAVPEVEDTGNAVPWDGGKRDPECCAVAGVENSEALRRESTSAMCLGGAPAIAHAGAATDGRQEPEPCHDFTDVTGRTMEEIEEGQRKLATIEAWERMQADEGISGNEAARRMGVSAGTMVNWRKAYTERGFAGLLSGHCRSGRQPMVKLTEDERLEVRAIAKTLNRSRVTAAGGGTSYSMALRAYAGRSTTREEVRRAILYRADGAQRSSKHTLPPSIVRAVRVAPAVLGRSRDAKRGTEAFFSIRGGMMPERNHCIEADDATINFACWVDWPYGGDPCSDRYGVKLGRFQLLGLKHCWSRAWLGFTYVARPLQSYRAEDVRSAVSFCTDAYGLPDEYRFEQGSWKANRVVELMQNLGVTLTTVYRSRNKPFVEGGWSSLWTILSTIDGQVGRYRGEMKEMTDIYLKCRQGKDDPRDHFLEFGRTVGVIGQGMTIFNTERCESDYGKWIPAERLALLCEERPLRQVPEASRWTLWPEAREWTVRKGCVGGAVELLEGWSVYHGWTHERLWEHEGQRVRVFFDPWSEDPEAVICAMDGKIARAGGMICRAQLLGKHTLTARGAMGLGDTDVAERDRLMRAAGAVFRREHRAICAAQARLRSASETRTMDGASAVRHQAESARGDAETRRESVTRLRDVGQTDPGPQVATPRTPWSRRRLME